MGASMLKIKITTMKGKNNKMAYFLNSDKSCKCSKNEVLEHMKEYINKNYSINYRFYNGNDCRFGYQINAWNELVNNQLFKHLDNEKTYLCYVDWNEEEKTVFIDCSEKWEQEHDY